MALAVEEYGPRVANPNSAAPKANPERRGESRAACADDRRPGSGPPGRSAWPVRLASPQFDAGGDRQMVAAGGGQGTDVTDRRRAGHDLVDPGQRQGSGEAEGEAPFRHVHP